MGVSGGLVGVGVSGGGLVGVGVSGGGPVGVGVAAVENRLVIRLKEGCQCIYNNIYKYLPPPGGISAEDENGIVSV